MEFSESLNFGNSTFMNLENMAKRAIGGDEGDFVADAGLDKIDESPTNNNKTNNNKARSRLLGVTTSKSNQSKIAKQSPQTITKTSAPASNRREFRKTKSDSTFDMVPQDQRSQGAQIDNYSDFFRSDFTMEEQQQDVEDLSTHSNKNYASDLMRISQIEAAFKDASAGVVNVDEAALSDSLGVAALDDVIFSEDLNVVLGEELQMQLDFPSVKDEKEAVWHDSFLIDKIIPTEASAMVAEESACILEAMPHIDETSFIAGGVLGTEEHYALNVELEHSRREVVESMKEEYYLKNVKINDVNSFKAANTRQQNRHIEQTKDTVQEVGLQNLESLKHIGAWHLPTSVQREYEKKGIQKMFDWQVECLSNPKVLFEHRNLVYSAPTSAGKTLVSEILLIKAILERGKKVLLILPFISVVREKMFYLQDLLLPSGYRVEGFFGGYTPPGGFDSINVAICTIEKANAIVNRLLEQDRLSDIGIVVVDEVHLISDPGRGYILELLLAKILYMSQKHTLHIQIVTMSATLANVALLQRWLDAELYITNFRPVALQEMIKVGNKIYDSKMIQLRELSTNGDIGVLQNDADHVAQLCIETMLEGCSVVVFCPSKDWCEKLAIQLAGAIHALGKSGNELGTRLRTHIKRQAIDELKRQMKDIPTGLDAVLERTITFACAFHHAGLTMEERDLVEASFKSGTLKVIVATSTLSSGVNLPARRVLIRTPLFGGKQMNPLTYRQMIGRAGRTGKDTLGESILVCTETNARIGRELVMADLKPITSCLEMESSTHLKRALLEVISSGVASSRKDIEIFVNCTLLSTEKRISDHKKEPFPLTNSSDSLPKYIKESLDFLIEFEFIRLQLNEDTKAENYVATRLGLACLASSLPPTDGLILFAELQRSRRCFVLESELHAVYLVTPYSVCYQLQDLDWLLYLDLWEKLKPAMKKVGELVGVKESFLVRAMRGQTKLDYKLMQIHKRFYTALALQELVNEIPINQVALKYKCTRGMLQSLQQMASTFAGIVTAFCNSLNWSTLALIVSQFKERLFFGIHRDLIDLMRLPDLNQKRARALFDAGFTSLIELANADCFVVQQVLLNALSFDTEKQQDNENAYEAEKRNMERNFFITGKAELTVRDAAKMLVQDARVFVQYEIGVGNINWSQIQMGEHQTKPVECVNLSMSCEDVHELNQQEETKKRLKRKSNEYVREVCIEQNIAENIKTNAKKFNTKFQASENPKQKIDEATKVFTVQTKSHKNLKVEKKLSDENNSENSGSCSKDVLNDIAKNTKNVQLVQPIPTKLSEGNKKLAQITFKNSSYIHQSNQNSKNNSTVTKLESKERSEKPKIKQCHDGPDHKAICNYTPPPRGRENFDNNLKNSAEFKTPAGSNTYKLRKSKENVVEYVNSGMQAINHVQEPMNLPLTKILRRSPRNHLVNSTRNNTEAKEHKQKSELKSTKTDIELFMNDDDSFQINSGVVNALKTADKLGSENELNAVSPIRLNKSNDDDIPSSQKSEEPVARAQTPHASRFMRSYRAQRAASPKIQKSPSSSPPPPSQPTKITTSDIEISDISVENSIMQNPQLLNASHILSCSKEDASAAATSFKSIEIIDICGDQTLFKEAFKELNAAQRISVSVGLQQDAGKRKPLIGANLLINQIDREAESSKEVQFLINVESSTYVAGIGFSITNNVTYYMNMQDTGTCKGLTKEIKCKYVNLLLASTEHTLLMHDAKDQLKVMRKAIPALGDICVSLQDPKIANWLLQPDKSTSFENMAQQFAPECADLVKLSGSGRGYSSVGLDAESAIYAKVRCSIEACVTVHILKGQLENLERIGSGQLMKFFKELEMPLQLSLCNMETYGFPTNESALHKLFQQMVETMKKLETKIYEIHGTRFNLGSTSAVARVLGLHRKSNGRISTSRQILEKIDSPISQLIISYRKLTATLTKNIQPLLKCVVNDRIHGQSITFTSTGRISMTEPNLQNVAKDFLVEIGADKIMISCRSAFYAIDDKRCLIASDFCQLEMRILAHLSQDPTLLEVMNSETDVFTALAARWNKISENKVSEVLRNGTKQICYGIVYGMGMRSLAEALKCTEQEANCVSEQFHAAYPGIRAYADKVIKFARLNGYIETITGRRRYLVHINSSESHIKKQAERQAINSTIQGSAADIAKSAIIRMEKNIVKYREKLGIELAKVQLVLHMHDELIFEVPEDKAKKIAKVLSITMENCVKLNVPLKVKLKIGKSWGSLKEVKV